MKLFLASIERWKRHNILYWFYKHILQWDRKGTIQLTFSEEYGDFNFHQNASEDLQSWVWLKGYVFVLHLFKCRFLMLNMERKPRLYIPRSQERVLTVLEVGGAEGLVRDTISWIAKRSFNLWRALLIPISLWISVSDKADIIAPLFTLALQAATYQAGMPTQSYNIKGQRWVCILNCTNFTY